MVGKSHLGNLSYNVFLQDVGAMEWQQRVMESHPDAPTIDINVDAPHLAMQQLVRRLIEEEQAATAAYRRSICLRPDNKFRNMDISGNPS